MRNNWQENNMHEKRRKRNMQEENPCVRRQESLTILGLGFFTKVVMAISL
jgi:hypothetical protein